MQRSEYEIRTTTTTILLDLTLDHIEPGQLFKAAEEAAQ